MLCKKKFALMVVVVFVFAGFACGALPKNTILFIGDGMGAEQVKAAGMYLGGSKGVLGFELLLYQGDVTTYSANSKVTDSAAAGTALATGTKVNNGVISLAIPGNSEKLPVHEALV